MNEQQISGNLNQRSAVKLSDCCSISSGGTPSKSKPEYWNGDIPWFSPKDIKSFHLSNAVDHISREAVDNSATRLIPRNTILVVNRSGVLAHTLPVGIVQQESSFNQDIKAIIPNDDYLPEFIAMFLKANETKIIRHGVKKGPTVHSLIAGYIEDLEVPQLNLNQQRRVAEELRLQFSEVQKATRAAKLQLSEIDQLANAIIRDSLAASSNNEYCLGEVLEEIKNGVGKEWKDYAVYGATRAGLSLAKEPPGKNPQRYKPITADTVFYNPMRILIGSIAYASGDDLPGITSPDYVVLKGKHGLVSSLWFYYWLRSPLGRQCINSLARGAVRERMLFNRLSEGKIALPEYAVQEQAAQFLKTLRNLRTASKKQIKDINLIANGLPSTVFDRV